MPNLMVEHRAGLPALIEPLSGNASDQGGFRELIDRHVNRLSERELLEGYKGQSKVERGFRFLTDPQFVAYSPFLESERRITALLMVMTLCLLDYATLHWCI